MATPKARPPRSALTRSVGRSAVDHILDAAERVLVQDGYDIASTNRIAQEAGISIGALYHHFPNKEAVVAAVIERYTDSAEQFILEQMMEVVGESYAVIARTMLEAYVGFLQRRRPLVRVILEQVPRLGQVNKISAMERRMEKAVRNYLTNNRSQLGVANIEAAVFISVHTISLLGARIALDPPPGATTEELICEVHRMMIRYMGEAAAAPALPRTRATPQK
ncbi:MAG: TetR/AcrR family transcriptional regulator [Gammaproteobacteria bacterium]